MYTREQASALRQAFWTAFGNYMNPVPSTEGLKTNWINYNTGLKYVYFRLQADKRTATIAIELIHPDIEMQELYFEQFLQLRTLLHEQMGEIWQWDLHTTDENGKTISRIYQEISPVSVFNQNDWPTLISFFKPRLMALDEFWNNAQYSFDDLR